MQPNIHKSITHSIDPLDGNTNFKYATPARSRPKNVNQRANQHRSLSCHSSRRSRLHIRQRFGRVGESTIPHPTPVAFSCWTSMMSKSVSCVSLRLSHSVFICKQIISAPFWVLCSVQSCPSVASRRGLVNEKRPVSGPEQPRAKIIPTRL